MAQRDLAILEAIGRIYCRAHHEDAAKDHAGICPWCRNAIDATFQRSQQCPYGHQGNCQDCDIKCQRGEAQANIKTIMAYSAPRMALRHPMMTLSYLRKKLNKSQAAGNPGNPPIDPRQRDIRGFDVRSQSGGISEETAARSQGIEYPEKAPIDPRE